MHRLQICPDATPLYELFIQQHRFRKTMVFLITALLKRRNLWTCSLVFSLRKRFGFTFLGRRWLDKSELAQRLKCVWSKKECSFLSLHTCQLPTQAGRSQGPQMKWVPLQHTPASFSQHRRGSYIWSRLTLRMQNDLAPESSNSTKNCFFLSLQMKCCRADYGGCMVMHSFNGRT